MLVTLGGKVELIGTLGCGLRGFGLGNSRLAAVPAVLGCDALQELTYELDSTVGSRLFASLLTIEEKALSGLSSPRGNMMADLGGLLRLQIGGEVLGVNWTGTEPKVLLGVDEVPAKRNGSDQKLAIAIRFALTWGSSLLWHRVCPPQRA